MPTTRRIAVVVTPDVRSFFTDAEIKGQGGFQSLSRTLAERLRDSNILRMEPDEFRRIVSYANNYGDGGFQARLRRIIASWVNQNFKELV